MNTTLYKPTTTATTGEDPLPGRITWTCPLGMAEMVLDTEEFDFHLDASPDAPSPALASVLAWIAQLGFEPMDEDECEPELLDNGQTRIYLVPTVPVDDAPLISTEDERGAA